MFNFNTNNIIVGHIKESLKSFNLPTFKIVDKVDDNLNDGVYLQKSNSNLYIVRNGKAIVWKEYRLNDKLLNLTKNFKINSLIYDSYTHTYLGDYLRFIRDYLDLDLMPLYNCFTGDMPKNLNFTYLSSWSFNSADTNYKIFMCPIKLDKKYTIAIDCPSPIEMFVGAYDEEHLVTKIKSGDSESKLSAVYNNTYVKRANSRFKSPFIYDTTITDKNKLSSLITYEPILKLFIKIPFGCNSTITILEGDYTHTYLGDYININTITENNATVFRTLSESIINTENSYSNADIKDLVKPTLNLQLLALNDEISYPFSDRLLEYLVGNVITNIDDISNNILRTQKALVSKKLVSDYSKFNLGKWNAYMSIVILNYLQEQKRENALVNNLYDNLGYVDKDIERLLELKDESWDSSKEIN